jgi:sn-glycerol 3-phosphate transport system substrate-binding protein
MRKMNMNKLFLGGVVGLVSLLLQVPAEAKPAAKHKEKTAAVATAPAGPVEISLRHGLEGRSLDALATLTLKFNETQKGKARVVLQGVSGFAKDEDKRQLPHMALLHPEDELSFFDTLPRFRPLYQVLGDGGVKQLDAKRFYPLVADAVDDSAGRLQALPLGLSFPVLFWNKDAFRKAGLDPEHPPRTWMEVQNAAGKLYDIGSSCPFTSSHFAWMQVENLSAQHNEPLVQKPSRIALNSMVNVKHLAMLASWHKSFYFRYYGPRGEGDQHFLSGECGMLTSESSLFAEAMARHLPVGVSAMPYYDDVYGVTPRNVMPDGAGLWFLAGYKKADYVLMADFVTFLMRPENQRDWVRATGYLPMTADAITALKESGGPADVLDAAARHLSDPKFARIKSGGALERLRSVMNVETEALWRNEKPAKEVLDTAMSKVNGPSVTAR